MTTSSATSPKLLRHCACGERLIGDEGRSCVPCTDAALYVRAMVKSYCHEDSMRLAPGQVDPALLAAWAAEGHSFTDSVSRGHRWSYFCGICKTKFAAGSGSAATRSLRRHMKSCDGTKPAATIRKASSRARRT